jgi:hypothetical protein
VARQQANFFDSCVPPPPSPSRRRAAAGEAGAGAVQP